jgi:hypothetical protein
VREDPLATFIDPRQATTKLVLRATSDQRSQSGQRGNERTNSHRSYHHAAKQTVAY